MDRIDREIITVLLDDGRTTYLELGKRVHLTPNTVAERVKRLQRDGIITGFHAHIDPNRLGRSLTLLIDLRLSEGTDRATFERSLRNVPQVTSAIHITGEFDYQLRVAAANAAEIETIIDLLKRDHGVRALQSRLVLGEVSLGPAGLLDEPNAPSRRRT